MKGLGLSVIATLFVTVMTLLPFSFSFEPAFARHITYNSPDPFVVPDTITINGTTYPVAGWQYEDTEPFLIGVNGTAGDAMALIEAGFDTDYDGIENSFEANVLNTDPNLFDTDGDGQGDGYEIMFGLGHPDDLDSDDDGIGDFRDPFPFDLDGDADGLSDYDERFIYGTNLVQSDSDNDSYSDGQEIDNGWNPLSSLDPLWRDTDGDKLPDLVEDELGTDKNVKDTDGDGLEDSAEHYTTDDNVPSFYLPMPFIGIMGYDPTLYDTDGDGISDGQEDPDRDGLVNVLEILWLTVEYVADTDFDRYADGYEVEKGTHPLDPFDHPDDGHFVVPESPMGSAAVILSALAALLLFVGIQAYRKRSLTL